MKLRKICSVCALAAILVVLPVMDSAAQQDEANTSKFEKAETFGGLYPIELAYDGNFGTYWHSPVSSPPLSAPFNVFFTLKEETSISGFSYTPRPDHYVGIITAYELYGSLDGETYTLISAGEFPQDNATKTVNFGANVRVKNLKFTATSGVQGYATIAEFDVTDAHGGYEDLSLQDMNLRYLKSTMQPINTQGMSVEVTSQEDSPTYNPMNLLDGNASTLWHSKASPSPDPLPISITIDMGREYTVCGIQYLPRQDGYKNGMFLNCDIFGSLDGETFTPIGTVDWESDTTKKEYRFPAVKTRFVKITVNQGVDGFAIGAEIALMQDYDSYYETIRYLEEEYRLQVGQKTITGKKEGSEFSVELDVAPVVINGTTFIPLRGLLEKMGASVSWEQETRDITVKKGNNVFLFTIGDERYYANNARYNLAVAPFIQNDRTFLPLRVISEKLGYSVDWDGETQSITIKNKI